MSKLLTSGFSRLWKNKYFWICNVGMAAFAVLLVMSSYITAIKYETQAYLDGIIFSYVPFVGVIAGAFISLFLGTEYSDGTIRNKLIVGHRRSKIYLSNLIVCGAAATIICAVFMFASVAVGLLLGVVMTIKLSSLVTMILTCFALCLSYCGLFTLVAMLCQNKAAVAVICVVGAFALLMLASYLLNALSAPEYTNEYYYDASAENWIEGELVPNKAYVSGIKRQIFEFLNNFLPGGQALQIAQARVESPWILQCYSYIIVAVSSAIGMIFFRRKDLK